MTSPSPDTDLVERLHEQAEHVRLGIACRYPDIKDAVTVLLDMVEALTVTKVYVAVDHTGCIYECEDEDRVIRTARSAFATAVRRAQQQEPVGEVEPVAWLVKDDPELGEYLTKSREAAEGRRALEAEEK